jgi:hypothetical protein
MTFENTPFDEHAFVCMMCMCVDTMPVCILAARTRSANECSKSFHHLSSEQLALVQQRAGISMYTHSHICLFHYNKYLFHWRGEGCIDPQCSVRKDQQSALVKCPQWMLGALKSIRPLHIDYPIGSLMHKRPCYQTFEQRYEGCMGFELPRKRQRTPQPSTQDMECDEVYAYIRCICVLAV